MTEEMITLAIAGSREGRTSAPVTVRHVRCGDDRFAMEISFPRACLDPKFIERMRDTICAAIKEGSRCWPMCDAPGQDCECLRSADEAVEKILKTPDDA